MKTKNVIDHLSNCWIKQGFEFTGINGQFKRPVSSGFQSIIVSTTAYDKEVIAEIHLGIRYEKIEKVIYNITKGLKDFESNSHTLLTSMGRMLAKRYHRYTCSTEGDIVKASVDIEEFMDTQGWLFLNQLEEIDQLHALFNTFSNYNDQLFYNSYVRAIRGLTIAKLVDNNAYQELKGKYEMQLIRASYPESYRSSFNALTLFLENYSEN